MKKIGIVLLVALACLIILPNIMAKTATDVLQTIPPILVSNPTAIAMCTVLTVVPGSVIAGQSGVLSAFCPFAQNNGAINFPQLTDTTRNETPTFILTTGFTAVSLQLSTTIRSGSGCLPANQLGFNNTINTGITLGQFITNGASVTFVSQGLFNATHPQFGFYDYCLWYSNPPVNGIATFTIAWTP